MFNAGIIRQKNADWLASRATGASGRVVLIVEDSETDIYFLLRAFAQSSLQNPVFVVRSGAEAISYLEGTGIFANRCQYPLPSIVFLDLTMPGLSGYDVLRWKRERGSLPRILWVAVSNFDAEARIKEAYETGASTFLSKPLSPEDLERLMKKSEGYWVQTEEILT
jgi:CheY-like chemotaxis protein